MLLDLGNKELNAEYSKQEYDLIFNGLKSKRRVRCKEVNSVPLKLLADTLNGYVECVRYICGYADTGHEVFAILSILGLVNIGKLSYELQESLKGESVDTSQITIHNVRSVLSKYSDGSTLLDNYIQALNNERNKLVHQVPAMDNLDATTTRIINDAHTKKISLLLRTYTKFLQSVASSMRISSHTMQNVLLSEKEIVVAICRFVNPKVHDNILADYNLWLSQSDLIKSKESYSRNELKQLNNVTNDDIQMQQLKVQQLSLEIDELQKTKERLAKEVEELELHCKQYKVEQVLQVKDENQELAQSKRMRAF